MTHRTPAALALIVVITGLLATQSPATAPPARQALEPAYGLLTVATAGVVAHQAVPLPPVTTPPGPPPTAPRLIGWESIRPTPAPSILAGWAFEQAQPEGEPLPPPPQPRIVPPTTWTTNEWRDTVALYFPAEAVDLAMWVIECESGGDPLATNAASGAAGLFQHVPEYWAGRSRAAGWEGADIYFPLANVAVAAWLWAEHGGFYADWYPSEWCWAPAG